MPQFGIHVDDRLAEKIEEQRMMRNQKSDGVVSRSDVCREWLELGRVADRVMDEYDIDTDSQHRKAILRQALYDHFRSDDFDESD